VLLLCLGKATKLVERLMELPKVYRASARLDVTSESFDSERPLIPVPIARQPTVEEAGAAARRLEGLIEQVPPAVSALKVGGRRAYRLERSGRPVTLQPRPARVYWLHIHTWDFPRLDFEVACGRGVYVRALIRDLGALLGVGGCLTGLSRTRIGPFAIEDAWTLERLEREADPLRAVIPLARVVEMMAVPSVVPPRPAGLGPGNRPVSAGLRRSE
jgi:tRNA pseudouridine55 synthase